MKKFIGILLFSLLLVLLFTPTALAHYQYAVELLIDAYQNYWYPGQSHIQIKTNPSKNVCYYYELYSGEDLIDSGFLYNKNKLYFNTPYDHNLYVLDLYPYFWPKIGEDYIVSATISKFHKTNIVRAETIQYNPYEK